MPERSRRPRPWDRPASPAEGPAAVEVDGVRGERRRPVVRPSARASSSRTTKSARPVGRGVVQVRGRRGGSRPRAAASGRPRRRGRCGRRPASARSRSAARLSASSSTHSPITVVEARNRSRSGRGVERRPASSMSPSRASWEAYIGTAAPLVHPLEGAGQRLGVERQVGDDVGAAPAGQQAGLGALVVGQPVDGADQSSGTGSSRCRTSADPCGRVRAHGPPSVRHPASRQWIAASVGGRDDRVGGRGAGEAHHPGCPGAQPQGHLARPAARLADRLHRAVRLRQVLARLRHDLRRGPAPLRRVAVGLRPAVPRPDGQARRRLHRGALAGGLDRPEVDLQEPALDGRHHHRGLRLPPAALRARRPRRTARSAARRSSGRRRSRSSTG